MSCKHEHKHENLVLNREKAELLKKIGQLEKYAGLCKLIMKAEICCHGYKVDDGDCHGVDCTAYDFCKLRSELEDGAML